MPKINDEKKSSKGPAVSHNLAKELEEFELWRQDNLEQLDYLQRWLMSEGLANLTLKVAVEGMQARLLAEEIKVAVVGEFSRGKSELINAIFFASSGRRVMPVSAGRTTMCTVELGYNEQWSPGIRFLPIETRLGERSLVEWCSLGQESEDFATWVSEKIDVDEPTSLSEKLTKLGERRLVTPQEAAELGLWDEESLESKPLANALGLVEIPKWRHVIVNYPHPLLKRGVTILDTPGLNAIGMEPELTLELLPQAHAILFVLGADTGVTRTDLQIWNDYLSSSNIAERPCYVILNKIDVLWDELLSEGELAEQIDQQKKRTAALLDIPLSKIFTISAQKGLLGKIKGDTALIERSQVSQIERLLVRNILPQRQKILQKTLTSGLVALHQQVSAQLDNQMQSLDGLLEELQEAGDKNQDVVEQLTMRLSQQAGSLGALREHASKTRVAEKKVLHRIGKQMSYEVVDAELTALAVSIRDPGMRVSLSKIFEETMQSLGERASQVEELMQEFEELVSNNMRALELRFGITLTIQPGPGVGNLLTDIEMLKDRHEAFFGVNQMLRLRRTPYAIQIYKTLLTRTRSIFDEAYDMLDMWSSSSYNVLVAQVQSLEESIQKLQSGIDRVRSAKDPLNERIDHMEDQRLELFRQRSGFEQVMLSFDSYASTVGGDHDALLMGLWKPKEAALQDQSKGDSAAEPEALNRASVAAASDLSLLDDGMSQKSEVKDTDEGKGDGVVAEEEHDYTQYNLPDNLDFVEEAKKDEPKKK